MAERSLVSKLELHVANIRNLSIICKFVYTVLTDLLAGFAKYWYACTLDDNACLKYLISPKLQLVNANLFNWKYFYKNRKHKDIFIIKFLHIDRVHTLHV